MESYQGADECGEQARGNLREIAEETGKVLRDALLKRGDDVVVDARPAERVSSVDGYHAVVLDSAVYAGHWLEPARQLAERHAEALAARAWAATTAGTGRSFSKK